MSKRTTKNTDPQDHDGNWADWVVECIQSVFHRIPPALVYAIATIGLAISNILEPRGGLASVLVQNWGMSLIAYQIVMLLFVVVGSFMIGLLIVRREPWPELYVPFAVYLLLITVATFARFAAGDVSFGFFGKTAFVQVAHLWLLLREITWPE